MHDEPIDRQRIYSKIIPTYLHIPTYVSRSACSCRLYYKLCIFLRFEQVSKELGRCCVCHAGFFVPTAMWSGPLEPRCRTPDRTSSGTFGLYEQTCPCQKRRQPDGMRPQRRLSSSVGKVLRSHTRKIDKQAASCRVLRGFSRERSGPTSLFSV